MNEALILSILFGFHQLESSGGTNVRDNGDSVGEYQIKKIFVREVNWKTGRKYTYESRRDRKSSEEMIQAWLSFQWKGADVGTLYSIGLTYKCGVVGAETPTAEEVDYANRFRNIVLVKYHEVMK